MIVAAIADRRCYGSSVIRNTYQNSITRQDLRLPSGNTCPAEFIGHLQRMVDNSFQIGLGFRP